jgi:hypothetical protein
MASTTSTKSSFGQTLQFITDIKLQELEKQRVAYQARAKVIDEVNALGENDDIIKKAFQRFLSINRPRAQFS